MPLVVLTVNIPGSEKRTPDSLVIARAALDALRLAFEGRILYEDSADLQTGWESYIVVSMSAAQAKEVTVEIEENILGASHGYRRYRSGRCAGVPYW